ncbi:probable protein phosphatase 2C 60 [Tanacetum coccineum]
MRILTKDGVDVVGSNDGVDSEFMAGSIQHDDDPIFNEDLGTHGDDRQHDEDNEKPMDDLVDDTKKKVEAPPRKISIWSGRKADSPMRNIFFSPQTKLQYFDRDYMEFDDMKHAVEENGLPEQPKKNEWLDYGEMMGKTDDDGVMMVGTPKTKDGENGSGRHDLSSMQGWHATMEDDHAAHPDLDSSASFFDVLYVPVIEAGKVVAKFCAKFLHQQVLKQEAYPTGNIETFVQKSFLRCDRGSDMVPERRRRKSKGGRVGLQGVEVIRTCVYKKNPRAAISIQDYWLHLHTNKQLATNAGNKNSFERVTEKSTDRSLHINLDLENDDDDMMIDATSVRDLDQPPEEVLFGNNIDTRGHVRFAPQLHESAGGLPKTKLVSHSCSLTGSTSAMKVSNWGGHLHFREVGE